MDSPPKLRYTHKAHNLCVGQGTAYPEWPRHAPIIVNLDLMPILRQAWDRPADPSPTITSSLADSMSTTTLPDIQPQPPVCPRPDRSRPAPLVIRDTLKSLQARQAAADKLERLERMDAIHRPQSTAQEKRKPRIQDTAPKMKKTEGGVRRAREANATSKKGGLPSLNKAKPLPPWC